jgi:hypothetical protein
MALLHTRPAHHRHALQVWFGMFGYNPGAVLLNAGNLTYMSAIVAKAAVNSALAASSGALVALCISYYLWVPGAADAYAWLAGRPAGRRPCNPPLPPQLATLGTAHSASAQQRPCGRRHGSPCQLRRLSPGQNRAPGGAPGPRRPYNRGKLSLPKMCHGLIAGLVMVSSGSPVIEPYAAILAGAIGAALYIFSDRWLLITHRVDDATAAIATQVRRSGRGPAPAAGCRARPGPVLLVLAAALRAPASGGAFAPCVAAGCSCSSLPVRATALAVHELAAAPAC